MIVFIKGFFLSVSLIVAIGAQNAFIIKQGIHRNHIFAIVSTCFICDIILMCVGIFGVGELLAKNRYLNIGIAIVGIAFVVWYGILSLKSALKKQGSRDFSDFKKLSLKKTLALTLAVTLLNPQVYLDAVFVIGAYALVFDFSQKVIFAAGALSASFLWFFGLGYFTHKLSGILVRYIRFIDAFTAFIMFFIAYSLAIYVLKEWGVLG